MALLFVLWSLFLVLIGFGLGDKTWRRNNRGTRGSQPGKSAPEDSLNETTQLRNSGVASTVRTNGQRQLFVKGLRPSVGGKEGVMEVLRAALQGVLSGGGGGGGGGGSGGDGVCAEVAAAAPACGLAVLTCWEDGDGSWAAKVLVPSESAEQQLRTADLTVAPWKRRQPSSAARRGARRGRAAANSQQMAAAAAAVQTAAHCAHIAEVGALQRLASPQYTYSRHVPYYPPPPHHHHHHTNPPPPPQPYPQQPTHTPMPHTPPSPTASSQSYGAASPPPTMRGNPLFGGDEPAAAGPTTQDATAAAAAFLGGLQAPSPAAQGSLAVRAARALSASSAAADEPPFPPPSTANGWDISSVRGHKVWRGEVLLWVSWCDGWVPEWQTTEAARIEYWSSKGGRPADLPQPSAPAGSKKKKDSKARKPGRRPAEPAEAVLAPVAAAAAMAALTTPAAGRGRTRADTQRLRLAEEGGM